MNEKEFKKKAEEIVRARMPWKKKIDSCVELLWRIYKANARDIQSAIKTEIISKGIRSAGLHLNDLKKNKIIDHEFEKAGKIFIDQSNPASPFAWGHDEIESSRKRNFSGIIQHMGEDPRVAQIIKDFISVHMDTYEEMPLESLRKNDELVSELVKVLETNGFNGKKHNYGRIGFRNISYRWYMSDTILRNL